MSIVRVGATKQYSDNWSNIFAGGGHKATSAKSVAKTQKKSPKKSGKTPAKTAAKKKSGSKGKK